MTASTSSRLRSISSCERASRLRRSSGSVFDGRTLKCQSSRVDREAVEVRDRALRPEALLQLCSFAGTSATGRVQLAGDEVALAEGAQELRELRAALRDQLEHQQERDDAGVGLREVAEVVVARDLAGERGVVLAHPLLDERVADAVDERHAAGALDRLGHGPARAHVVDDLRAGLLLEDDLGEAARWRSRRGRTRRCRRRRSSGRRRRRTRRRGRRPPRASSGR